MYLKSIMRYYLKKSLAVVNMKCTYVKIEWHARLSTSKFIDFYIAMTYFKIVKLYCEDVTNQHNERKSIFYIDFYGPMIKNK